MMELKFIPKKKKPVNKKEWHRWFAWRPVRLDNNSVVWLENVLRKLTYIDTYAHDGSSYRIEPNYRKYNVFELIQAQAENETNQLEK